MDRERFESSDCMNSDIDLMWEMKWFRCLEDVFGV